jgi:zinc protease
MAHLLEHLTFKGSTNHPNITQELSAHGGWANGTTWLDRTNYYITLPASEANIDWVIKAEADRMLNAFVTKKVLDTEMTVVRNELEIGENDSSAILEKRVRELHTNGITMAKRRSARAATSRNVPIDKLTGLLSTVLST